LTPTGYRYEGDELAYVGTWGRGDTGCPSGEPILKTAVRHRRRQHDS